ncbi:hypothetical protein Hbor_33110 (plasmid) [Halogeometricum borinquense DSM 11551]|uniref:Uncharacterized protein n=1 Tax=Halogeometricum borinquense (strain ATCC 700274 / DSM 11551 / JCM 10706 / KCTC 4070 / PR3) TaxID=469382 RepID=E4NVF2_HALBP|nr:hypothetical protein Hbor_33110 [Halogeometricum borinquense DSM 11551]
MVTGFSGRAADRVRLSHEVDSLTGEWSEATVQLA